jgi:hypothetical protein
MKLDFNKPCFILGQGTSIAELENWIDKFKDLDVYWVGYCAFHTVEPIISKIGKHFDILYIHCQQRLGETLKEVKDYLNAGGDRLAIVNRVKRMTDDFPFILKDKTYKTDKIYTESEIDGGSLQHLLLDFIILGFTRFCLFGCDGREEINNEQDHYKQELYDPRKEEIENPPVMRIVDTIKMNYFGMSLVDNYKHLEVYNCNPKSHVKCFQIISYDKVKEIFKC